MKYLRLYRILVIFRAYRLSELLIGISLPLFFRLLLISLFWVRSQAKDKPVGKRLSLALQELGPVWIKLGQMLSTRRDLLSIELIEPLTSLQDNVAPFDGQLAKQIIEDALGQPIETWFEDFSLQPLASASIAQVHSAILKQSKIPVVIKVLRPDILPVIDADIALMYWVAEQVEKRLCDGHLLKTKEIVKDYQSLLYKELNLLQEAQNTQRLRQNFINSDQLYIPYVYQELCRENVLVEEHIYGVPISDIEALKQKTVDLKVLAERGVQVFFTQVFRDNFFHADMHPGNIFIDISDPALPRYIGIDCAIVGELSKEDQYYLAENFIAFFNRDYQKIASLYISSGWVPEETDKLILESAIREVCEPIFAKPLGEISFAHILLQLFKTARRFKMELQPQLILLQKTLFYIEGLGRQLYPQLDLWTTAKPFLENWYRERVSICHITKQLINSLPQWQTLLPELPAKIKQYEKDNKRMANQILVLNQQLQQLKKTQKNHFRVTFFAISVAIIISVISFIFNEF